MKETKSAPVELLLVVVDNGKSEEVQNILDLANIHYTIAFRSTGTATTEIANLFSFGLIDRDIIGCFIDKQKTDEILTILYHDLDMAESHSGIALTIPLNGASSNLLNMLEIKY